MAGKDRTAAPHESIRHDEAHSHPRPVPHLKPEWDNHGPDVSHPHQHVRGGGHTYDHHDPAAAFDRSGDDIPNPDLKQPPGVADNNSP